MAGNFQQFVSDTDLHAQAEQLQDAGTPLPEVATDIDGETRDETPSIGADEYSLINRYTITYTYNGQGTVGQLPDAESYDEGVQVELSAIPADGWVFIGWGGDVDPTLIEQNPVLITMDMDKEITATFVEELILSAIATPATCSNLENGSIDLTVSGGSGVYTYDWDNDLIGLYDETPDTEDLSNLLPDIYTVIVEDENGLSKSLSIEVTAEQQAVAWYLDSDGDNYAISTVTTCDSPGEGYTTNVLPLTDCDDSNATVNPGATEVIDGVDNNCDGTIDEGFTDADGDGYAAEVDDCNDTDVAINPGATEIFDGVDNNCDGTIDEGFTDADGDGYAAELDDCNDADVAINPGATEIFDGVDNNCDGTIDEGFTDLDNDGYAAEVDDCDDTDVAINPGATEIFDGVDNNCDGTMDEGFTDADGDGYAAEVDDCNDADVAINPGTTEIFDGVDNDCDGLIDEGFTDLDNDGYAAEVDDCNDADVAINPGTTEILDGVDNNCDGTIDEGFTDLDNDGYAAEVDDCNDADVAINPGTTEIFDGVDNNCDGTIDEGFTDADGDGYAAEVDDCNDADVAINPGTTEIFDGVDNNCDGTIDEGFTDADGDGYAAEVDDCNDADVAINPGTTEIFDGVDNNCDGTIDEGFTDADGDGYAAEVDDCDDSDAFFNPETIWYLDTDNDQYAVSTTTGCESPGLGYTITVLPITDCDDTDANIYPDENGICSENPCLNNSSPEIISITAPSDPFEIGIEINVEATYTDAEENIKSVTWLWGDGYDSDGTFTTSEVFGSHRYIAPGVYTVTCIIEDECGAYTISDYQYLVAYDPSGGFVTGAGWIYSPEGSYSPNPLASGDAKFGFVSKYKKGRNIPEGRTQFEFLSEDFSFVSSEYEWLIVAGEKAMFKGVGNINGVPGYKFMISVIDNDESGDKFRIKIWEELGSEEWVIYDNHMGASEDSDPESGLIRGSIKIHNPKGKSKTDSYSSISSADLYTLAVYPNPLEAEGVYLQFSERGTDETFVVRVYDLYGRQLAETNFSVSQYGGEYFWPLDHSGWEQGIYLLRAKSNTQEFQIKLVK
ncbi:MopE-related protein [Christiangramia sabulilitoris]|uniref:T9SS type A sorting domain-containing protein n=1 Tax=Christiangramia sabulilitoris TaxID=2583991 RepID=A0A550HX45_9FLAO|nr:MopE-related protein [Christiangramia sabulilitoris]TRO63319.1 T9SS type A sorting domain-containing protein [Christiangramia sabulilitoris]